MSFSSEWGSGGFTEGSASGLVEVVVVVVVFVVVVVLVPLHHLGQAALVQHHAGQVAHLLPLHHGACSPQGPQCTVRLLLLQLLLL